MRKKRSTPETQTSHPYPNNQRTIWLTLFLISAATLTFEITLTRLFSVEQFYHFAFMIVSIALLGFGASGTVLTIFPKMGRKDPQRSLGLLGLATGISILGAYLLIHKLPFDSFSIAWDRRQVGILVLHYVALATPFFFSGMAVGLLLDVYPKSAGQTYAVNLLGSAVGCVAAMLTPPYLGAEGTVALSSGLAALGTLLRSVRPAHHGTASLAVQRVFLRDAVPERRIDLPPLERLFARGRGAQRGHPFDPRIELPLSGAVAAAGWAVCGRGRSERSTARRGRHGL